MNRTIIYHNLSNAVHDVCGYIYVKVEHEKYVMRIRHCFGCFV